MTNTSRWRRRAVLALLAALLGVAVWHYATLYREATASRSALLDLEDSMSVLADLGLDATPEDLDRLEAELADANHHIDRASTHVAWDPLLQAARWLPVIGDQVVATSAFLDIASALVEAGDEGVEVARNALEVREEREGGAGGMPVTVTALELLEESGPALDRIEALVDRAVAKRIEIGDRALLGPLADARARLDEHLPGLVETLDQATVARDVVPELLGFEGERRYLLLSLNNAELMPGGGLVTGSGILTVEDGHVTETTFHDSSTWVPDWEESGGGHIEAPAPLARHLLRDHTWNIGLSNWNPDFEDWSQQALEFYRMTWGADDVDEIHGVVAVDLDVLEGLLDLTGGQTVEAPGFGEIHVTSENAFIELERVTRAPEDTWRRSKAAVGSLQEHLIREVLELPVSQWSELAEVIRTLGDGRHLQVALSNPRAQSLVTDVGWSGALLAPEGDFLHLSEASVNSTKLNEIFVPSATYEIDVSALGTARHHLVLSYENTVREWAEGRDPELVTRLMYDGQYGGYLRAFTPRDASALTATIDGQSAAIEDRQLLEDHRWQGFYFAVPPAATREVALSWDAPQAMSDPDTYRLLIQKQPGRDGICIDLDVSREGVPAASVEVTGGERDEDGRICLTTDVRIEAQFGG